MGSAVGMLNSESPDTAELESGGVWLQRGSGAAGLAPHEQSAEDEVPAAKRSSMQWTLERHLALLEMITQVNSETGRRNSYPEIVAVLGGSLSTIQKRASQMLSACAEIHANRTKFESTAADLQTATEMYNDFDERAAAAVLNDLAFAKHPNNVIRWGFGKSTVNHQGYGAFVQKLRHHGRHLAHNTAESGRGSAAASRGVAQTAGLTPGASAAHVDPSTAHIRKIAAKEAAATKAAEKQASAVRQHMMLSGASGGGDPYAARAAVAAFQHSQAASNVHAPVADAVDTSDSVLFDHESRHVSVLDLVTPEVASNAGGSSTTVSPILCRRQRGKRSPAKWQRRLGVPL